MTGQEMTRILWWWFISSLENVRKRPYF